MPCRPDALIIATAIPAALRGLRYLCLCGQPDAVPLMKSNNRNIEVQKLRSRGGYTRASNPCLAGENREDLIEILAGLFATQPCGLLGRLLNGHDIPAARVRDLYEMLENEQVNRHPASQFKRLHSSEMTAPIAAFRFASLVQCSMRAAPVTERTITKCCRTRLFK